MKITILSILVFIMLIAQGCNREIQSKKVDNSLYFSDKSNNTDSMASWDRYFSEKEIDRLADLELKSKIKSEEIIEFKKEGIAKLLKIRNSKYLTDSLLIYHSDIIPLKSDFFSSGEERILAKIDTMVWNRYLQEDDIDVESNFFFLMSKVSHRSSYNRRSKTLTVPMLKTLITKRNDKYLRDSLALFNPEPSTKEFLKKELISAQIEKKKTIKENQSTDLKSFIPESSESDIERILSQKEEVLINKEDDVKASFSVIKSCYGTSDNLLGMAFFRPKVVYMLANNYTENSGMDGVELRKSMGQQLRNFKNSNDRANFLTVVYLTELPSWPSDVDLDCDRDGPKFPPQNDKGETIYLCKMKYNTRGNGCGKIERLGGAVYRMIDESGSKLDGQEICH